ncbi:MAG: HTH domain-containing protein [Treponema sp.]|nr:HTH domain-containing protein [Treponema sp.]
MERFFRNLLLNEHHELKNRFTHIDYDEYMKKSSQKSSQKIIEMIKQNSEITTQEMADNLGITRRAVAKSIAKLQEQGVVRRVGADKGGHWEVLDREDVDG